MGKYEPLAQFLRKQQTHEVRLTFGEIERIVGAKLPPSARKQRAWWSNNPDNSVMTKVWLWRRSRRGAIAMASYRAGTEVVNGIQRLRMQEACNCARHLID